jgi:hypothetical protein
MRPRRLGLRGGGRGERIGDDSNHKAREKRNEGKIEEVARHPVAS